MRYGFGMPSLSGRLVGHLVRTTNRAELTGSEALIPGLWATVLADRALLQSDDRVGDEIVAALFDYESDENGAYSQLVGVRVAPGSAVPPGLATLAIADAPRVEYDATGEMPAALIAAWGRVWDETARGSLQRAFGVDVEVHRPDGSASIHISGTRAG